MHTDPSLSLPRRERLMRRRDGRNATKAPQVRCRCAADNASNASTVRHDCHSGTSSLETLPDRHGYPASLHVRVVAELSATDFRLESGRIWPSGPSGRHRPQLQGQPRRVSAHALTSKGSVQSDRSLVSRLYPGKRFEQLGRDRRIRLQPSWSVTAPLPWLTERIE